MILALPTTAIVGLAPLLMHFFLFLRVNPLTDEATRDLCRYRERRKVFPSILKLTGLYKDYNTSFLNRFACASKGLCLVLLFARILHTMNMADNGSANAPPAEVTNAVLVKSEEMPEDAQKVEELDFNKLKGPITAEDLFLGMKNMGFQATSMSEAIRIINDMVSKQRASIQLPWFG
jgi:hypothetical protein